MTTQTYLHQLLTTSSQYELSERGRSEAENNIQQLIFQKLTSKKFRKTKMESECAERTKRAIELRVIKSEPIHVVFPQGGYKLWRFPSSPEVDWAEFFNISYLLKYIAPIAKAYQPGAHLTYYMHTLLMELHDNLTTNEIQAYVDSFESLLDEFRKYLPKNITISILRDADLYTRDEYFAALEKGKKLAEDVYRELSSEKKDDLARMANLNIKWDGAEDWTKFTEAQKADKIKNAALYEMAATSQLSKVATEVKAANNVLVFTKGTKDFIGIGSTRASVAKYWVGFGVLQKKGDSYLPLVLSPSQYEKVMQGKFATEKVDVVEGRNFGEVMVVEKLER